MIVESGTQDGRIIAGRGGGDSVPDRNFRPPSSKSGRTIKIPPALWATGGLEGPRCPLPCFPTGQNPRGGVYPSPLPCIGKPIQSYLVLGLPILSATGTLDLGPCEDLRGLHSTWGSPMGSKWTPRGVNRNPRDAKGGLRARPGEANARQEGSRETKGPQFWSTRTSFWSTRTPYHPCLAIPFLSCQNEGKRIINFLTSFRAFTNNIVYK